MGVGSGGGGRGWCGGLVEHSTHTAGKPEPSLAVEETANEILHLMPILVQSRFWGVVCRVRGLSLKLGQSPLK